MRTIRALAERVAERLGRIEGVCAVALGGSWARQRGLPNSNIDITFYYRERALPDIEQIHTALRDLDEAHAPGVMTGFGAWGPWVNGGARIRMEGREVDIYYRELDHAETAVSESRDGTLECHSQIGDVDTLCNYITMGEIHYCRVLHDPAGDLARLKTRTAEYPPLLKRTLIKQYLRAANRAINSCQVSAARGDTFHVAGGLFRCIGSLVQVLYALNEKYFVSEKCAVGEVGSFLFRPPRFAEVVATVLSQPGENSAQLDHTVRRVKGMVKTVQRLCAYYGPQELFLHQT